MASAIPPVPSLRAEIYATCPYYCAAVEYLQLASGMSLEGMKQSHVYISESHTKNYGEDQLYREAIDLLWYYDGIVVDERIEHLLPSKEWEQMAALICKEVPRFRNQEKMDSRSVRPGPDHDIGTNAAGIAAPSSQSSPNPQQYDVVPDYSVSSSILSSRLLSSNYFQNYQYGRRTLSEQDQDGRSTRIIVEEDKNNSGDEKEPIVDVEHDVRQAPGGSIPVFDKNSQFSSSNFPLCPNNSFEDPGRVSSECDMFIFQEKLQQHLCSFSRVCGTYRACVELVATLALASHSQTDDVPFSCVSFKNAVDELSEAKGQTNKNKEVSQNEDFPEPSFSTKEALLNSKVLSPVTASEETSVETVVFSRLTEEEEEFFFDVIAPRHGVKIILEEGFEYPSENPSGRRSVEEHHNFLSQQKNNLFVNKNGTILASMDFCHMVLPSEEDCFSSSVPATVPQLAEKSNLTALHSAISECSRSTSFISEVIFHYIEENDNQSDSPRSTTATLCVSLDNDNDCLFQNSCSVSFLPSLPRYNLDDSCTTFNLDEDCDPASSSVFGTSNVSDEKLQSSISARNSEQLVSVAENFPSKFVRSGTVEQLTFLQQDYSSNNSSVPLPNDCLEGGVCTTLVPCCKYNKEVAVSRPVSDVAPTTLSFSSSIAQKSTGELLAGFLEADGALRQFVASRKAKLLHTCFDGWKKKKETHVRFAKKYEEYTITMPAPNQIENQQKQLQNNNIHLTFGTRKYNTTKSSASTKSLDATTSMSCESSLTSVSGSSHRSNKTRALFLKRYNHWKTGRTGPQLAQTAAERWYTSADYADSLERLSL